jgi:hypothetical protein
MELASMSRRWFMVLAVAAGPLLTAGCGNPAGYFPVSGKVLYKGEPASGATVYFHPTDGTVNPGKAIPYAIAGQDGGFYLTCDGIGDGCPPGKYAVLVEWRGKPDTQVIEPKQTTAKVKAKVKDFTTNKQVARVGVDRLKGRYFDIAKPLLRAEVAARTNSLAPFELND